VLDRLELMRYYFTGARAWRRCRPLAFTALDGITKLNDRGLSRYHVKGSRAPQRYGRLRGLSH
jgi:hypothetical protein